MSNAYNNDISKKVENLVVLKSKKERFQPVNIYYTFIVVFSEKRRNACYGSNNYHTSLIHFHRTVQNTDLYLKMDMGNIIIIHNLKYLFK